jgi:hypothetical protein
LGASGDIFAAEDRGGNSDGEPIAEVAKAGRLKFLTHPGRALDRVVSV